MSSLFRAAFAVVLGLVWVVPQPSADAGRLIPFQDPAGDPTDCSNGDPLERPAGDILGAGVDDDEIFVQMARDLAEVFDPSENFSIAVRILPRYGGMDVRQVWFKQQHAGETTEGALDAETGEPVPPEEEELEISQDGDTLRFKTDGAWMDSLEAFRVEAFNTPNEGDPKSCDELTISNDDLLDAPSAEGVADDDATDDGDAVATEERVDTDGGDDGVSFALVVGILVGLLGLAGLLGWLFGPWSWSRGGGGDDDGPLPPPDSAVDEISPPEVL